jgi:hypothetical protein
MANPIQPRPETFRAELEDGQVVEADGSTVADPATGTQVPAVLLRMTPGRAHTLAHVLDDWAKVALVFATLRSSEAAERSLGWSLETGAAALGDAGARRCPRTRAGASSAEQRLAALAVLRERELGVSALQGVAVIDAAARWLAEDNGEELAQALLQAVCRDPLTANFVYLALIEPGRSGQ